ncbi:MAG: hypothetical protein Q8936_20955 [Bacillota bacterium]|nr:hypothetical protein [Bacillota bacterium]
MEFTLDAIKEARSKYTGTEFPKVCSMPVGKYYLNKKVIPRRKWYYGAVSVVAAALLIITLNFAVSFIKNNTVYIMDEVGRIAVFAPKAAFGGINGSALMLPSEEAALHKPEIAVPVDLKAEEGDQRNADAGHSPWKLDPVYVSQVFVSLKISPQGISGEYPVKYEDLRLVKNTGTNAVVEVGGKLKTPVKRVYLKKLIRQDKTGIWTVVGYDSSSQKLSKNILM